MLKKGFTALAVIAAISVGSSSYAAAAGTQNQGSNVFMGQLQDTSGMTNLLQNQFSNVNGGQVQVAGGGGFGQANIIAITGVQLQTGTTSGPATVAQGQYIDLFAGQTQTGGSSSQDQATNTGVGQVQITNVSSPSFVTQLGVVNATALQFQVAIPNGPKMQRQLSNASVFDFQAAVSR